MSKQSVAKKRQQYAEDIYRRTCINCFHFMFNREVKPFLGAIVDTRTNLRCGLGGFKVKSYGTCNEWKAKSC